jgi:2-polyprenyl-6-methoxyphenol hydroxylase-like FAD-dependent oxidoreductase
METSFSNRRHAVVTGGSFGGLLAARILGSHFENVTIIEKDVVHRYPETRKGQPHTRHLHGLLPSGLSILSHYFPGILKEIVDQGAEVVDFAQSMNWFAYGGYKKSFVIGLDGVAISRPLLEHLIRERVLALPNIKLIDQTTAKGLLTAEGHQKITGVLTEDKVNGQATSITASLIIDATGRGSHTPRWLQESGYEKVPVSEVKINVGYTTRIYKRDPADARGKSWMLFSPQAPQEKRFGAVIPIEGSGWMVTVGGWHHDNAPLEEKGYLEFVKSLPNPNIYDIASKCEPLSGLIPYKFPVSSRYYYEKMKRFPSGFLVLGDAISSFNPIYGQGMASACQHAVVLDNLLKEKIPEEKLAKTYFKKTAKIIDNIWQLATGEDFRFPQTTGPKPLGMSLINKYLTQVHRATITDEVVCGAFLKVMSLLQPPSTLFRPGILWRVLMRKRNQGKAMAASFF